MTCQECQLASERMQLLAAVGVTHEEAMAAAKLDADVAIRVEAQEKETACRRAKLMLRCGA